MKYTLFILIIGFYAILCNECNYENNSPLLCKHCGSKLTYRNNYFFIESNQQVNVKEYHDICPAMKIQYFKHQEVFI